MSAETLEFKTELKQLLDIITHSLYSDKDVFLRELISNGCDAIDRVRFNSLENEDLLEGDSDWKIRISVDETAGTLTVSDNGTGMSRESIVDELGTIAKSGTQAFLQNLAQADVKNRPDLIGQFGVGFYASFIVADRVTVLSRPGGAKDAGVRWESDGQGEYTIESVEKETRGTDVALHLREDAREYLQPMRLRRVVTRFSDFIEHPVVMDVEKEDDEGVKTVTEETLNTRKAIWLRPKSEVTEEEHKEFYKHISRDFHDPVKTIHYVAEGATEFRVLVYIPKHKPLDLAWGEPKSQLHLYVRRVFITDHCEALLPSYLRFVRGVVDCTDLPLNVSREMLQQNPLLGKIQKNIVKRVLSALEELRTEDYDAYVEFHEELGSILREGVTHDWSNRERIAGLTLFESVATESGKYTTLDKYVEAMPDGQEEIFYLVGEDRDLLARSPHVEAFRSRGFDVLLMTDPFDEFMISSLPEYKGKKLKAADRGALDADETEKEKLDEARTEFADLLKDLSKHLESVKDVRLSTRMNESAACLVLDEGAMGVHISRIMERIGRSDAADRPRQTLELKPRAPSRPGRA